MLPASRSLDPIDAAAGVTLTVLAHIAFIGLLTLAHVFAPPEEDAGMVLPVMQAELLMLGEQMPEEGELPWIANPEEAPEQPSAEVTPPVPDEPTRLPDQETVVLEPDEPAEPTENRAEPEEQPREAALRRDRGETDPNRPTNDRPTLGSPDGIAGGTSLSASAVANQLSVIQAQLSRALRRPAGLSDAQWQGDSARVSLRVSEAGQITGWEWVERSDSRLFDNAVSSMLNRFRMGDQRLRLSSISDQGLRNTITTRGLVVTVQPDS